MRFVIGSSCFAVVLIIIFAAFLIARMYGLWVVAFIPWHSYKIVSRRDPIWQFYRVIIKYQMIIPMAEIWKS
jgi:hypothetical protein